MGGAFPQFSNLTEQQVTGPVLTLAQQYCRVDGGSPVCDVGLLTEMLNLMVAHVAQILYGSATQPVTPTVGRLASATEGSVSVSFDFPTTPSNAWFVQTPYGAAYWQLILPYRLSAITPRLPRKFKTTGGPWWGY